MGSVLEKFSQGNHPPQQLIQDHKIEDHKQWIRDWQQQLIEDREQLIRDHKQKLIKDQDQWIQDCQQLIKDRLLSLSSPRLKDRFSSKHDRASTGKGTGVPRNTKNIRAQMASSFLKSSLKN